MISRRNLLLAAATGLTGIAGVAYTNYWEPGWFDVTHHRIPFFNTHPATTPLKILFLADLHYSRYVPLALISQAIALGLAQKPDIILLGGDYVLFDMELDFPALSRTLSPLAQQAPTFACYGNHDRKSGTPRNRQISDALSMAGIEILCNTARVVHFREQPFHLFGMGDLWSGECQSATVPVERNDTFPRLVLAHNPDSKEILRDAAWDLMLCGHTHGGQMHIPLIGEPFAPVKDKRYVAGLHTFGRRLIYTTRGVGSLYGMRLNCRPEITLLELV